MLGKRINDRYELLSVVGGGGMAVVYKARDLILDRIVAVKVLRSEFSDDDEFIRRFRREARSVASLSHPNIVNIYDIGDDTNDVYYIVMEYVEGETLKQLIKREAPLPLGQALHMMDQITAAISHAHDQHIVHRDIKPHNILIDENGHVKVTDFGIAVAMTSATITHTNSVMGSAHYFSPEQARGGYADTKSDIYSLGIVLFEMLTGELPFSGTSPVSVALKHLQENIPDPRQLNPAIPQSVENIILKALSKDPVHRYGKVEDMQRDLRTALDPDRLNEPKFMVPDAEQETTKMMPPVGSGNHRNHGNGGSDGNGGSVDGSPDGDDQKKPGRMKKVLWTTLLLLLLVGGGTFAAFSIIPDLLYVDNVPVPKVVGMEVDEARDLLEKKAFKVDTEKVYSDEYDKGIVTRQNPEAKTEVKKGSTVHLFVSKGPEKITLDDYTGKDKDSVELLLKELNFKDVEMTGVYSDSYKKGTIIEQEPDAGTEVVPEKTVLKLTYSRGPETVEVPDLSGYTKDEAVQLLEEQGLDPEFQGQEYSDKVEEGEVTRQSPDPGTEVEKDEAVEFWISKGPKPEPEPQPLPFTQPITVEGPEKGKPADVKIVYSDANHDREVFVREKLKGKKTYKLDMVVEPRGAITVWVYTNGKLNRTIHKTYQQVINETAGGE
ncbi:MAG TPA: Stk1 family PASTA domain-containing Ser/Thr kinase [Bacillales bacterium]|nr:Stk1 family PASTA domain-containing Ser/Thr kinase [Bacillales bacterium]